MELVPCRVCKSPISPNAKECPICGEPKSAKSDKKKQNLRIVAVAVVVFGMIGYIWFVAIPDIKATGLLDIFSKR